MRLFADTSDPNLIEDLYKRNIIQGVTTNPTTASQYLKMAGGTMRGLAKEIAQRVGPNVPISVEAIGCEPPEYKVEEITVDRLYREGEEIISWGEEWEFANLWIKMPTIPQGIEAIYSLVLTYRNKANINSTLGFDYMQAMRAAQASAYVFSLFMGRMQANGEDPIPVARKIIDAYNRLNLRTRFLAASMRTPELILESWKVGADIATAPPEVLEQFVTKYPHEFEEVQNKHPEERRIRPIIVSKYEPGEFQHPLLKPGLERFISDAKSANYDFLSVGV